MRSIVVTLLFLLGASAACEAQQGAATPPPVKLIDYLARNDPKNPGSAQFILLRCAALYSFFANAARAEKPTYAEAFEKTGGAFFFVGLSVMKDSEEFALDQVKRSLKMYTDRALAAKANTGSWASDELISSDGDFCKALKN